MSTKTTISLILCSIFVIPSFGQVSKEERLRLRRTPVVEVFENAKDAVINISSTQIVDVQSFDPFDRLFEDMFDFPSFSRPTPRRRYKTSTVGSGFVIHPAGYIVTNAHVVARTVERKAIFSDGTELDAQIVALASEHDLAVLKIEPEQILSTLPFGRSDDLLIGETVIAIGNPLGLQNTVTTGIISALDRQLERQGQTVLSALIQTDASINPGSSGGPLLNILGELIGVNTAIRSDAQNIGFAIPVDQLSTALPELLDVKHRYRIDSGMQVSGAAVAMVTGVDSGGPAEKAGIRTGDRIRKIEGQPINKGIDFHIALIGKQADVPIQVVLSRSDRYYRKTLFLESIPRPDGAKLARRRLGIELQQLTPQIARKLDLPGIKGLVVTQVDAASPAARIGLKPLAVVVSLAGHDLADFDELGLLLETVQSGQTLAIGLLHSVGNGTIYIRIIPIRVR